MKRKAPRIVIAAPASGSGKTLLVCGILSALRQSGRETAAFKCGPDYIDPMFHEKVLGTPSKNLDTFFTGREQVRQLFLEDAGEKRMSVIEGVMGLFDGLAGVSEKASTWDVAEALDAPVILAVDASKSSLSMLALIRGFMDTAGEGRIRGVIFNRLSPSRYPALQELVRDRLGILPCGFLPKMKDIQVDSRHLGLVMPEEISDLEEQMEKLGSQCLRTLDLELLEKIADEASLMEEKSLYSFDRNQFKHKPVIAVARDQAFSFYYKDNLRLLEKLGARLVPFSPLRDKALPEEADGLLLGGGYPELHGEELEDNRQMRDSIRRAVTGGMPCIAECGGFLYLQEELTDRDGRSHAMAGVLQGKSRYTGRLSRFGYVTLTAEREGMAAKTGDSIRGHEFHYMDTDRNGEDYSAKKPVTGRTWRCGFAGETLYAGFPHLYLYSRIETAENFVRKAEQYERNKIRN